MASSDAAAVVRMSDCQNQDHTLCKLDEPHNHLADDRPRTQQ